MDDVFATVLPQLQALFTVVAVLVTIKIISTQLLARWYCAAPNEWLLLINNGELIKCGIGLSAFCPPGAQIVKFPSTMQETTFTASQA